MGGEAVLMSARVPINVNIIYNLLEAVETLPAANFHQGWKISGYFRSE